MPVVVGVSNAGTDDLVAFSQAAMAAGAMIAPLSTQRTEER